MNVPYTVNTKRGPAIFSKSPVIKKNHPIETTTISFADSNTVAYHSQQNVSKSPPSPSQAFQRRVTRIKHPDKINKYMPDMARMDYYLILTMCMSLLWGFFILLIGIIVRFGMGQVIGAYAFEVRSHVDLRGTVNNAGQNICPVDTDPSNSIFFGDWSIIFGSLVVITGTTIILFSATGFVAGLQRSTFLLLLVLVTIFAACGLEYYLLQVTTDYTNTFHEGAQDQLLDILHNSYDVDNDENLFAKAMNAIMLAGECCGIRGPEDFKNITFTDQDMNSETVVFTVAPACCRRAIFNSIPEEAFKLLKECAINGYADKSTINTKGCYEVLFHHMYYNYGYLIIVGLIVLSMWEMVQAVLTVLVMFTPPPVIKIPEKIPVEKTPEERAVRKVKKFIPYWQISSYLPEDLERIKSTEIW